MFFRFFKTLVFGNIFVAFCAYFLSAEELFFDKKISIVNPISLMIFFSTLFVYNYTRILHKKDVHTVNISQKSDWIFKHRFLIFIIVIGSAFGILISLFNISKHTLLLLSPLFIVSILYATPINLRRNSKIRLRQVPFLKVFLIAFVWTFVTYVLPLADYESTASLSKLDITKFMSRFLFILAIALPFDIRDMETDKRQGIKTLPTVIGEKRTKLLAIILLVLFCLLCVGQVLISQEREQVKNVAYIVSGIVSIAMIALVDRNKNELFFSFWIEGLMLLQFILLLLFRFVFL